MPIPELQNAEEMTIIAGVASAVAEHASQYGIDIEPICAELGLDPNLFKSMTARVSLAKVCRLLEACSKLSGDEAFGLRCVDVYERGASGPFGYGLIVAPDLRSLIEFLEEHIQGATGSSYFARETTDDATILRLTFSPLVLERDQYVDMATAMAMGRMRDILGDQARQIAIEMERPAPRDPGVFRHYLSDKLTFSGRMNSLTIPHALLDVVNPRGDARLFELMHLQCRSLHPSPHASGRDAFRDNVQGYLRLRVAEPELSLGEMARHFQLSERTLQRRLSEHGTSLNDLRDDIRREMSLTLLTETALPIADICYRLGYSAPSAFSRSVTRWFGASPRAVRDRHGNIAARR